MSLLLILLIPVVMAGVLLVGSLFVLGIAKNRLGLALTAVALGVAALLAGGLIVTSLVGYRSVEYVPSEFHAGPVHWQFEGPVDGPYGGETSWWLSGLRLLAIAAGVLAFAIGMIWLLRSKKTMGEHCIRWPQGAVLLLATIAMLGFIAVRWASAPVHRQVTWSEADEMQQQVARAHAEIAHQHARINIRQLEDEFTAPRIQLMPPEPPAAPAAPGTISPEQGAAPEAATVAGAAQVAAESDHETGSSASDDGPQSFKVDSQSDENLHDESVEAEAKTSEPSEDDEPAANSVSGETDSDTAAANVASDGAVSSDDVATAENHDVIEEMDTPRAEDESAESVKLDAAQAEAAQAATAAAKEITAGLASFAKALNRVIDEYARGPSPVARAPVAAAITSVDAQSTKQPPKWVEEGPVKIGNVQRDVVVTDEYATKEECYRARDIYLLLATYDHLAQLVGRRNFVDGSRPSLSFQNSEVLADGQLIISNGHPFDARLRELASMGVGVDFVRREIAKEEHFETTERSVGPMTKLYTLVEFNESVERELEQRWAAHQRQERFAVVGVGAASMLGLLGLVWGLLKVDTATKGYYTKRLFLGVPLGILGAIGLFVALINM